MLSRRIPRSISARVPPGVGPAYLGWDRQDQRHPQPIMPFGSGVFTRASEASFLASPSTIGWAASGEARYEDWRGPAGVPPQSGRLLKCEGAATNLLVADPATITAAGGWTAVGGATMDGAHATIVAPDGSPAYQITFGASANDAVQDNLGSPTLAASTRYCASFWVRTVTGTKTVRVVLYDGVTAFLVGSIVATTTWQRVQASAISGSAPAAGDYFQIRNENAATGGTVLVSFPQLETGGFATSAIRTAGGTRAADSMSWAVPPAAILNGRYRFVAYPMASSTPIRNAMDLYSTASGQQHQITAADHFLFNDGGTILDTAARTWSAGSRIEYRIDSALTTGAITYDIDGTATTDNFSAARTWDAATIFAGSRNAGGNPFYGCISEVFPW